METIIFNITIIDSQSVLWATNAGTNIGCPNEKIWKISANFLHYADGVLNSFDE